MVLWYGLKMVWYGKFNLKRVVFNEYMAQGPIAMKSLGRISPKALR